MKTPEQTYLRKRISLRQMVAMKTPEQIAESIRKDNPEYLEVKVLPDGSIAILVELAFTRAICLGADEVCPFTTRYCYEDRGKASELFQTLQSEDDVLTGYTATRRN